MAERAVFNTEQSDYIKYNGTVVEVGAELDDSERDKEVGRMWHIIFHDGKKADAFEDELEWISDWQRYIAYLHEWADSHADESYGGMSPVCYDEWLDNEEEEE